jgi:FtsH-binding integral membrane protein
MDGHFFMEIATWTVIAAIIVFLVMQAPKVAVAVSSVGNFVLNEQGIMTGGFIKQ